MSALFAGIGGGLFAHQLGTTLSPRELGFQKSIDIVIMVDKIRRAYLGVH